VACALVLMGCGDGHGPSTSSLESRLGAVAIARAHSAVKAAVVGPTAAAPVTLPGVAIPATELSARAAADAHNQADSLRRSSAGVAREAIDERWAIRDATRVHVLPSDAQVSAALARAGALDQLMAFSGMSADQLRVRVRGELAERALADRVVRRMHSAAAYGRYFLAQAKQRKRHTHCLAPFDPSDRCASGSGDRDDASTPLGIGSLNHYELQLNLAPLLGLESSDPEGKGYRQAEARLRRALPTAVVKRVRLAHDAYGVYAVGSTSDKFVVARVAHRLVLGHQLPVLLD
jgi:hypothetical protein